MGNIWERIMNESITIGQKVGFVVVIVFVLALSSTPFMSQGADQSTTTSISDGAESSERMVSIR